MAHDFAPEKRAALQAWEKRVLEIVYGKKPAPAMDDVWWAT